LLDHVALHPVTGCFEWTGALERTGYARVNVRGPDDGVRKLCAHRVAYELWVGPIPDGLQLDHLCRVRHCVNPLHLEPVTARENTVRGVSLAAQNATLTQCRRGHPFDKQNTMRWRGKRICRACHRVRALAHYYRRCPRGN